MVTRSIEKLEPATSAASRTTRSVLQPGLWPVIQIERYPRICFVLGILRGYAAACCARILGVEECAMRTLLQTAIMQLSRESPKTL